MAKASRLARRTFSTKKALMLVAIFAVIGIAGLIKSLAATDNPRGAELLISRTINDGGHLPAIGFLADNQTASFSLYKNGLALCGHYADNDLAHSAPYYAQQLSSSQASSLVSQVATPAFMQLKEAYSTYEGFVPSERNTEITVRAGSQVKLVRTDPTFTAIPTDYTAADQVISNFCNSLTTPYIPSSVTVQTKLIPLQAGKAGNGSLPSNIVTHDDESVVTQTLTGQTAKDIYLANGKHGSRFYNKDARVAQTVVSPLIPSAEPILPKTTQSTSFNFGQKAYAATPPVTIYRLCPSDMQCSNTGTLATTIKSFYEAETGKRMPTTDGGVWVSSHPRSYFGDALPAMLDNLAREVYNERHLTDNTPRIFILGFTTAQTSYCGYTYTPIPSYAQAGHAGMGIVDPNLAACLISDPQHFIATTAHELGHAFSLNHNVPDGANRYLMEAPSCDSLPLSGCHIINAQIDWLKSYSPFFVNKTK